MSDMALPVLKEQQEFTGFERGDLTGHFDDMSGVEQKNNHPFLSLVRDIHETEASLTQIGRGGHDNFGEIKLNDTSDLLSRLNNRFMGMGAENSAHLNGETGEYTRKEIAVEKFTPAGADYLSTSDHDNDVTSAGYGRRAPVSQEEREKGRTYAFLRMMNMIEDYNDRLRAIDERLKFIEERLKEIERLNAEDSRKAEAYRALSEEINNDPSLQGKLSEEKKESLSKKYARMGINLNDHMNDDGSINRESLRAAEEKANEANRLRNEEAERLRLESKSLGEQRKKEFEAKNDTNEFKQKEETRSLSSAFSSVNQIADNNGVEVAWNNNPTDSGSKWDNSETSVAWNTDESASPQELTFDETPQVAAHEPSGQAQTTGNVIAFSQPNNNTSFAATLSQQDSSQSLAAFNLRDTFQQKSSTELAQTTSTATPEPVTVSANDAKFGQNTVTSFGMKA